MFERAERRRKKKLTETHVPTKKGYVLRFNGGFINPLRQAKKALRRKYHCRGKRLHRLQKIFRRKFHTELS
jgi:hypothetical protein